MTWTKMITVEIERSQQILAILRVEFTEPGWWVTKLENRKILISKDFRVRHHYTTL